MTKIEWVVLEPPAYLKEEEMTAAQKACAKAIIILEGGVARKGPVTGNVHILKWDAQMLLHELRSAITKEKP